MLSTVNRTKALAVLPTVRRGGPATAGLREGRSRSRTPADTTHADVLRIIADPRSPTYVTVYAGGRRRYSYWRPLDSATGTGGCYAALPTAACDELHAAGRITLGEPVVDPNRTTYRVRPAARAQTVTRAPSVACPPAEPVRPVRQRARVA
ncbi:hypothetical protein [Streptomyces capillispiralis]|uniref:Uncharacterized protein n=1 Tax=Streptomyces capillispiralis TaxID=68182 RepID=A0A561TRH1_9ACTN|nr:hypothetical protein [Streptomyces capillispiralis]TWF89704.1 hypothetical protein FHX78_116747 [Streptomyces capillispiralis]GHH94023.1 hypothetical protein GCM10017779_44800 [Streptomyces capillispiralis]